MAGNPLLPADPSQVPYGQLADFATGEQQRQAALAAEPARSYGEVATPAAPAVGGLPGMTTQAPPEPQSGIGMRGPSSFPQAPGQNPVSQAVDRFANDPNARTTADGTIIAALLAGAAGGNGSGKVGESVTRGQQGMRVTPEMEAAARDARAATERAGALRGQAGVNAEVRAGQIADVVGQRAAAVLDLDAKQQKAFDEQQANLEKLRVEQDKLRADFVKEGKSLNPDRLLSKGGNRAIAAVSIALGAMGSAFTKGPNFALDIINNAIDRDYQAQKDRLGVSKENLSLSQQSIQQVRQMYSDANAQALAHSGNMKSVYADKIAEMSARHQGAEAKENGEILHQATLASAAADYLKAQQIQARTDTNSVTSQFSAGPTAGQTAANILDLKTKAATLTKAEREAYGPQVSEQDRGTAEKVKEKFAGATGTLERLEQLRKLNANPWTRNTSNERDSLVRTIVGEQVRLNSGASATESEREEYRKKLEGRWHTMTESGYNELIDQAKLDLLRGLHGEVGRLHPALRDSALQGSSLPPEIQRAITSGQYDGRGQAAALGGRVLE